MRIILNAHDYIVSVHDLFQLCIFVDTLINNYLLFASLLPNYSMTYTHNATKYEL